MNDSLLASQVRVALLRLHKGGTMRAQGLAGRVARLVDLPVADVHLAFGYLRGSGELLATDWHPDHEPIGLVNLAIERPESPEKVRWQTAMHGVGVSSEDQLSLLPMAEMVGDMPLSDLERLVMGLQALRADRLSLAGQSRYCVSARYLLSSSKMLDSLPATALRNFGIDPAEFDPAPGYVVVAGPPQPDCVVLVENPQAMELALDTLGVEDVAWVATFGYGLSGAGDEYGNQLASFIEGGRKRLHPLIRRGSPPDLPTLLAHRSLFFWGDLDQEGVWIYKRLQSVLPQLRLSALNIPMINRLLAGVGHPYVRASGKHGQKSRSDSDDLTARLLDICLSQAVDQEAILVDDIPKYAKRGLEMWNLS